MEIDNVIISCFSSSLHYSTENKIVYVYALIYFQFFLMTVHLFHLCARYHIPTLMYHDGCVSDGVFWYDHTVAVLVPLWRLVLHIGNGDGQLY